MSSNREKAVEIIERHLPPLPGDLTRMQAEKTTQALDEAGLLASDGPEKNECAL